MVGHLDGAIALRLGQVAVHGGGRGNEACRRRPILLFGRDFWSRLIDFELLIDTGMISPGDEQLFHYVETADEAWGLLMKEYDIGGGTNGTNGHDGTRAVPADGT